MPGKKASFAVKREKAACIQLKKKKLTQMHLDIGQKHFHSTICKECGFLYTSGDPTEDRLHAAHHKESLALSSIKCKTAPSGAKLIANDKTEGLIYKIEPHVTKHNGIIVRYAQCIIQTLCKRSLWDSNELKRMLLRCRRICASN